MTDDFHEAYRMAQALCEKDHGQGSWATAHRKRAWYMRRALAVQESRSSELHSRAGMWRRLGYWLKAVFA